MNYPISTTANRVLLLGHLGHVPDMKHLPSGEPVASFSLGTTERWRDKSGASHERTDWHRIEFIGRLAEQCCENLRGPMSLYIEGRIQYDTLTDKDGKQVTTMKVRGERMEILNYGPVESSADESRSPTAPNALNRAPLTDADFDDNIPF